MTIGQLSRRTGVPIKVLRTYEDLGFLYTRGRSESNYRLFGEETLWCVQVVQGLRSLRLTLKEIRALLTRSCEHASSPISVLLEAPLAQALARVEERLTTLQALRQRILEFQAAATSAPAQPAAPHWCSCWRQIHAVALCFLPLDSPTGGRLYTLCIAMHDSLAGWRWARRLVFQAGMTEPPALA